MTVAPSAAVLPLYHSLPNQYHRNMFLNSTSNKRCIRVNNTHCFNMASLGLQIRIPSKSLIQLQELTNKDIVVKFNGTREVTGKLMSSDKQMNMILQNAEEIMGIENGEEMVRELGLIIIKGSQIQSISLRDGFLIIDNPYAEAEAAKQEGKEDNEEQEEESEQEEEKEAEAKPEPTSKKEEK